MNTTAEFRTWTASHTGEVRHYFNGNLRPLLDIALDDFGSIETVAGKSVEGRNERSRLSNSLRAVKVWVDTEGVAHVTGWDHRLNILSATDVKAAVEAAYAAYAA
ncbi:MAG: hypothetical protein H6515_14530 [Microthrixaceae bacterium]|jgi:hypothetical protein|nr:hypothetical protein [Microthrixaceae bacterium]